VLGAHDVGDTALARLRVDADDGLVGASDVLGIDGQVARLGYENLRVWDARGAEVGARFAGEGPDVIGPDVIGPDVIGPDVIRIEVDDDGAVYPLTIDPTASSNSLGSAEVFSQS
jgi:hypothetical protein